MASSGVLRTGAWQRPTDCAVPTHLYQSTKSLLGDAATAEQGLPWPVAANVSRGPRYAAKLKSSL
jgi:hypothetical protein